MDVYTLLIYMQSIKNGLCMTNPSLNCPKHQKIRQSSKFEYSRNTYEIRRLECHYRIFTCLDSEELGGGHRLQQTQEPLSPMPQNGDQPITTDVIRVKIRGRISQIKSSTIKIFVSFSRRCVLVVCTNPPRGISPRQA